MPPEDPPVAEAPGKPHAGARTAQAIAARLDAVYGVLPQRPFPAEVPAAIAPPSRNLRAPPLAVTAAVLLVVGSITALFPAGLALAIALGPGSDPAYGFLRLFFAACATCAGALIVTCVLAAAATLGPAAARWRTYRGWAAGLLAGTLVLGLLAFVIGLVLVALFELPLLVGVPLLYAPSVERWMADAARSS